MLIINPHTQHTLIITKYTKNLIQDSYKLTQNIYIQI